MFQAGLLIYSSDGTIIDLVIINMCMPYEGLICVNVYNSPCFISAAYLRSQNGCILQVELRRRLTNWQFKVVVFCDMGYWSPGLLRLLICKVTCYV